jgi:hypothetical protein
MGWAACKHMFLLVSDALLGVAPDTLAALPCSRLSEAKLLFQPYLRQQLEAIVTERLATSGAAGLVENVAVGFACTAVARQSGEAGLTTLAVCLPCVCMLDCACCQPCCEC